MRSGLAITGGVIFFLALIVSVLLMVIVTMNYESPVEDHYEMTEGSGDMYLEEGTYTVWSDEKGIDLEITSPSGNEVDIEKVGDIEIMEVNYIGTIRAEEEGSYYFDTGGSQAEIYLQEGELDISQAYLFCSGCCLGFIFLPLGLILAIIGLVSKRK